MKKRIWYIIGGAVILALAVYWFHDPFINKSPIEYWIVNPSDWETCHDAVKNAPRLQGPQILVYFPYCSFRYKVFLDTRVTL